MQDNKLYDIAVIGGGLAGLAMAIQAAQNSFSVILFEKEQYPFHKVCGEYVSLESWNFIESLGLPLSTMNLPLIKNLIVTAPNGNTLQQKLPLGGFGISRYLIDNELKKIAQTLGVQIAENCKVDKIDFVQEQFIIQAGKESFSSKVCCGSFGKRSNLDIKWNRTFIHEKNTKLHNYIGIKYHIIASQKEDTIALHNFKDGYCGISKIEGNKYCICYLTTAKNLNKHQNSIEKLEKNLLQANPHLKKIFTTSTFLLDKPIAISQISFSKKTQIENHVLLLGDAAGMITPLCGNGMSIALHSSKIAMNLIQQFLNNKISREKMEDLYTKEWNKQFAKRLQTGRLIQKLFGKIWLTNLSISFLKLFPSLTKKLIQQTHGKTF